MPRTRSALVVLVSTLPLLSVACSSSDGSAAGGSGAAGAGGTSLGAGGTGAAGASAGKGGGSGAGGVASGAGGSGLGGVGGVGVGGVGAAGIAGAAAAGAAGKSGGAGSGGGLGGGASGGAAIPTPIHGVTVTDDQDIRDTTNGHLADVLTSLSHLSRTPTTRIVYTRSVAGSKGTGDPAASYLAATKAIKAKGYVMGQVVDSSDVPCYTVAQSKARFEDYVTTLGNAVDVWEIGNEINGEWLYTEGGGVGSPCNPAVGLKSTQADVVQKMKDAYDVVKSHGKPAALTLFYNDPACYGAPAPNRMTSWVATHIPVGDPMRTGLDYLLLSWYELGSGCAPLTVAEWQTIFDDLANAFPNAKLGISEFGYASGGKPSDAVLTDLVTRMYAVRPKGPAWAGGGFFWNYSVDAVPYDTPGHNAAIWGAVDQGLGAQQ